MNPVIHQQDGGDRSVNQSDSWTIPGVAVLLTHRVGRLLARVALLGMLLATPALAASAGPDSTRFVVQPTASGEQWVRVPLPFPPGLVTNPLGLRIVQGTQHLLAAVRPLTWYAGLPDEPATYRGVRRALVTFPYSFPSTQAVSFQYELGAPWREEAVRFPARLTCDGSTVVSWGERGTNWTARLIAPGLRGEAPLKLELVESNQFVRWTRVQVDDPEWPRVIELREDSRGGAVVVAHVRRDQTGNAWAPSLGWHLELPPGPLGWEPAAGTSIAVRGERVHSYTNGSDGSMIWGEGEPRRIYHPMAPLRRRGQVLVRGSAEVGWQYEFRRSLPEEKVPMQESSWQQAELVIMPAEVARLTPTLEWPHRLSKWESTWQSLYLRSAQPDLSNQPKLQALVAYHWDAMVRSMQVGNDWGNVSGYSDGALQGGVFGMNRLNHGLPYFTEAWRSGDSRLREVGLLWCNNFHDLSLWWGREATGGTRYNNMRAQNRIPPEDDQTYMWRSNDSVNFCTKGYDAFLLAYEETGDPRMWNALEAQLAYSAVHLHTDRGECRNIGDVRDFVHLYEWTGRTNALKEALRLFRELRTKLSTGDLFDQGGKPLALNPPFIEDDAAGLLQGYAKPYIIGYALAGLPLLARHAPEEPKLKEVIRAVADFMAQSQDPLGGWRYPHPRSSYLILAQAMEHAWQLVQADTFLGAQPAHLDAIERVLRQRIHGWLHTGKILSGLTGWEMALGKAKERSELNRMYAHPEDRDSKRDYVEGRADWGSAPPEGLVYFPEVLGFYLQHRPASRLLEPPAPEEPLGLVLSRTAKAP